MKNTEATEEDLEFLNEIINIGSGNAARALEQLLGAKINVEMPVVRIVTHAQLSSVIGSPAKPVVGVRMGIVGDVAGNLFFIVPDEHKAALIELAEISRPGFVKEKKELDESVFEEIGNIMAGVYLTAIHDFCGLNIYHTVPYMSMDMLLSLIDESIAAKTRAASKFILIENIFKVDSKSRTNVRVFFIIILAIESIKVFLKSIEKARKKMYGE